ncbi:pre-rRNA-processing protein TSR2 homolog [Osmerus eperlanus]|uniref:pre-rRNA-processing protein TSR2 homolog n=1 Tax=Osmerus eperlanus TaxID=29151 RepID=UPI002E1245DB
MEAHSSTREVFTEAVRAVLETWPVLQIAVDNGFGGVYGQDKADWMVDVVQQYFHDNANLQQYEVEDFIADLMNNEFDTVVDDGSLPQIAERISEQFLRCQQGKLAEVREQTAKLVERKVIKRATTVTAAPTPGEEEGSEDETEAMECEGASSSSVTLATAPARKPDPPAPEEEDDGWTVVRKKK